MRNLLVLFVFSISILTAQLAFANAADNALLEAAYKGDEKLITEQLKSGANVNAVNQHGETPLMLAVISGNTNAIQILLDNGADRTAENFNEGTVLTHALVAHDIYEQPIAVLEYLLKNGCDANHKDSAGGTAIISAAGMGILDGVKILIDYGADVNVVNKYGSSALSLATQQGKTDVVELLKKHGAK